MDFKSVMSIIFIALILFAAIMVYFIPSIVADRRKNKYVIPILAINLFGGWTVFAWIFALYWAITGEKKGKKQLPEKEIVENHSRYSPAEEITRYKALLDQGILTQEEFDEKKKQLLNL